jgi:6-phospho-3-hexuloisomerase
MDERIEKILSFLRAALASFEGAALDRITGDLMKAPRLFTAGSGRSGLVARMFAMRLMHLGLPVHVVGETTTPAARAGDALVCVSGSGETESTFRILERARQLGLRVILVTASPCSRMASLSHEVVLIQASGKHGSVAAGGKASQLLGSGFEQGALLVLEAVVSELSLRFHLTHQEIAERHTNLE